jgi:hypothetical protein
MAGAKLVQAAVPGPAGRAAKHRNKSQAGYYGDAPDRGEEDVENGLARCVCPGPNEAKHGCLSRSLFAVRETGQLQDRRTTRCSVPAKAFVIRFPNGDFEYDFTRRTLPSIGGTIRRKGQPARFSRSDHAGRRLTMYVELVDREQSK